MYTYNDDILLYYYILCFLNMLIMSSMASETQREWSLWTEF